MTTLKNTSLSHIRGFNYQPTFSFNGVVRWLDRYDAAIVEKELARAKELFPWMNAIRVWLSQDAWMGDRDRFLANLREEMAVYRKLNIMALPVIFNGWRGVPDYGGLGPMHAKLSASPGNLRRIFLGYVKDAFEACGPEADTVCAWDLCNEPFLHYKPGEDIVRPGFARILEASAGELRALGAKAPIGVGNWGNLDDEELCAPFVDCMLSHRYWAYPAMEKFEWFEYNVNATVEVANKHNFPLVFTECGWGRWNDLERADALVREAKVMLDVGAGVVPYTLWESPVADSHGRDAGFTYDDEAPGDLCFIRRDGSLRPGHDRINELMQ